MIKMAGFSFVYIGTQVLDIETRRLYKTSTLHSKIPTLDNLLDFVSQRCKVLENIGTTVNKSEMSDKNVSRKNKSN